MLPVTGVHVSPAAVLLRGALDIHQQNVAYHIWMGKAYGEANDCK